MRPLLAFVLLCLSLFSLAARADEMMIVRSSQEFEEAMSTLQAAIKAHGYTLTRVQRVDVGLEAKGYKTDKYRVVFFGKPDEVKQIVAKHPELIPYLPLNIAIFAENNQTLLTTNHPAMLAEFFPDPDLAGYFKEWEKDVTAILDDVRQTQ